MKATRNGQKPEAAPVDALLHVPLQPTASFNLNVAIFHLTQANRLKIGLFTGKDRKLRFV